MQSLNSRNQKKRKQTSGSKRRISASSAKKTGARRKRKKKNVGLGATLANALAAFSRFCLQSVGRGLALIRELSLRHVRITVGLLCVLVVAGLFVSGSLGLMTRQATARVDNFLVNQGVTVDEVRVSGRKFTSKAALSQALGVKGAVSFLRFDLGKARQRVEALHWVDEASIMRFWPDTLIVSLTEKQPIAVWQIDQKLFLVDRDGEVISDDHHVSFPHLLHVVGKGASRAAPELVELLSLHKRIAPRVRAAIRVGERRWTLRLDNGIDVLLPDERPGVALSLLAELQDKFRLLSRDVEIIDLRQPDRLYLRSRSNPQRSEVKGGMGA